MKVLVTGGNGHIGYNLVEALIKRGYRVRATIRDLQDPSKAEPLRKLGVELFQVDVLDLASLELAMDSVDGVFHAASPNIMWAADSENEIARPHIEGTLNVLASAHRAGVKRVIMISSCAAIGLSGSEEKPLSESDWNLNAVTPLVQTKVKMEKMAWEFAQTHGLDLITICPPSVIGPGFHRHTPNTRVYAQILQGKLPPLPEGGCHMVDARDLAEAQCLAFETPTAQGRYIVAGQFFKFSEFIALLRRMDPELKLPRSGLPIWVLQGVRVFDWLGYRLFNRSREVTGAIIQDFVGKYQRVSTEKILRDLSWKPRPAEETIRDTFQWIQVSSL